MYIAIGLEKESLGQDFFVVKALLVLSLKTRQGKPREWLALFKNHTYVLVTE